MREAGERIRRKLVFKDELERRAAEDTLTREDVDFLLGEYGEVLTRLQRQVLEGMQELMEKRDAPRVRLHGTLKQKLMGDW